MTTDQLNLKVLASFGITAAPSLEQIKSALTDKQLKYIEKHKAQLVITPSKALYELIDLFDKKQSQETYIYKSLWDQYDFGSSWRVDFVLPDLKFTNQTYEKQRESLAKEKKSCKGLDSIDPRTYIMLNAIRRENGEDLLDTSTWTRLIQLPKKSSDGDSWVPLVDSFGGQVYLGASDGGAYSLVGVRVSVGQDLDFKSLSSFDSSSPSIEGFKTDLAANTVALNRLSDNLEKIFKLKGEL